MSALGDYVTRLMMDTTPVVSSAASASQSVVNLSGTFATMMGQLDRFEQKMRSLGATPLDKVLGLANAGATEGQITAIAQRLEYVLDLHRRITQAKDDEANRAASRESRIAAVEASREERRAAAAERRAQRRAESAAERGYMTSGEYRQTAMSGSDAFYDADYAEKQRQEAIRKRDRDIANRRRQEDIDQQQAESNARQERLEFQKDLQQQLAARRDTRPTLNPRTESYENDEFLNQFASNAELRRFIQERKQLEKQMDRHNVSDEVDMAGGFSKRDQLRTSMAATQAAEVERRIEAEADTERAIRKREFEKTQAAEDELYRQTTKLHKSLYRQAHGVTPDDFDNPLIKEHATQSELQRFARERDQLEEQMSSLGLSDREKQSLRTRQDYAHGKQVGERHYQDITDRSNAAEEERIAILNRVEKELEQVRLAEDELTLARLRQKGASQSEIDAAQQRVNAHTLKNLKGATPEQEAQLNASLSALSQAKYDFQKKNDSRAKWAGVEGFRAIEDFAQGAAYGGIKGGMLAASNNIAQMGAAWGAYGAMAGSALSLTVIIGAQIYDMWTKNSEATERATRSVEGYNNALKRTIPMDLHFAKNAQERDDIRQQTDTNDLIKQKESLTNEMEMKDLEIWRMENELKNIKQGAGVADFDISELEQEAKDRANWVRFAQAVLGLGTPPEFSDAIVGEHASNRGHTVARNLQLRNLPDASLEEKVLNTIKEGERSLEEMQKKRLADSWKILEIEERIAKIYDSHWNTFDDANAKWSRLKNQEKDPLTMREIQQQRWRGMDWTHDWGMRIAGSEAGQQSMWGAESLRAQDEYEQNIRKIQRLRELNVIDDSELASMSDRELAERDRKIRMAKYGNQEADGRTGFQGQDFRTSGGFNALLKAIQYKTQSDELAELKKHGDIQQDISDGVKILADVNKHVPLVRVDF